MVLKRGTRSVAAMAVGHRLTNANGPDVQQTGGKGLMCFLLLLPDLSP